MNVIQMKPVVSLPAISRSLPVVLTAGPEVRLANYDREIVEYSAKQRIGLFIQHQEELGRFRRPAVSPFSLAKTILKLARKKVVRVPMGDVMMSFHTFHPTEAQVQEYQQVTEKLAFRESILAAGCSVLSCYASHRAGVKVFKAFEHAVPQFSYPTAA